MADVREKELGEQSQLTEATSKLPNSLGAVNQSLFPSMSHGLTFNVLQTDLGINVLQYRFIIYTYYVHIYLGYVKWFAFPDVEV